MTSAQERASLGWDEENIFPNAEPWLLPAQTAASTIVRMVTVSLLLIFAIQNLASTSMTLLMWTAEIPLFFVVLVFSMLGFACGYLAKRSASRNKARIKTK